MILRSRVRNGRREYRVGPGRWVSRQRVWALRKTGLVLEIDTPRGFAAMTTAQVQAISKVGGVAAQRSGHAHRWTAAQARRIGKTGGRPPRKGPK